MMDDRDLADLGYDLNDPEDECEGTPDGDDPWGYELLCYDDSWVTEDEDDLTYIPLWPVTREEEAEVDQ